MKLEIEIAEVKFRVECTFVPACYESHEPESMEIHNISLISHGNTDMTGFFRYLNENELDWNDIERLCLHAYYELE